MVSWIGLKQLPILYDRDARHAGETNYPLHKMIRLALDAITGFSVIPLRLASMTGTAIGGIGLLLLIYTIGGWMTGRVVEGWTSLMIVMLILGGAGKLYGGILGSIVYMVARDQFSGINPQYWYFWIGMLLIAVVVFLPNGLLGGAARLAPKSWRRES
jgi:ABC-type branched-subunit amino acid transport system permease subunit